MGSREVTALKAMNETLRDSYVEDSQRGLNRFNKVIRSFDIDFELRLPHRAFHRNIGAFAGIHAAPDGTPRRREDVGREAGRVVAERGRPRLRRIP